MLATDFVISLPRRRNYFGQVRECINTQFIGVLVTLQVNVIRNDQNLAIISQDLQGEQVLQNYQGFLTIGGLFA